MDWQFLTIVAIAIAVLQFLTIHGKTSPMKPPHCMQTAQCPWVVSTYSDNDTL